MRSLQSHTSMLVRRLPPGAWERAVLPRMVLPPLRRLSVLDPLHRMPLAWIEEGGQLRPPLGGVREGGETDQVIVVRYWALCKMAKDGLQEDEDFFSMFYSLASSIMHTMVVRETMYIPPDTFMGLHHQIFVLTGRDGIYGEIKELVSRANKGIDLNICGVAIYIRRCGAEDYALFVIERMSTTTKSNQRGNDALQQLRDALLKGRANEAAKTHALRMALHPRATGAAIRVLGGDLLLLCAREARRREKIVLWEDVLAEWLEPMLVEEEGEGVAVGMVDV
jgi:hypothetical protein